MAGAMISKVRISKAGAFAINENPRRGHPTHEEIATIRNQRYTAKFAIQIQVNFLLKPNLRLGFSYLIRRKKAPRSYAWVSPFLCPNVDLIHSR